jgi:hypothetical protein
MMTHRSRLFSALNGDRTDRVPIWLLFPYHSTSYYADVRRTPCYQRVVEASYQYAITLNRRNPAVKLFSPDVREWEERTVEGQETITRSFVEFKGRRLYAETRTTLSGTIIKRLLCSPEDLDFYCSLPLNLNPTRISAKLDEQLPTYLKERAEFPEELGSMMLDLGEPVVTLYHASKLEEYALWSVSHNDLVVDFLDRLMAQKRLVYAYFLERHLAEVFFLVGSELASPPLVSPRTFQRWVMPYATQLIDQIHQGGAKAILHYHGFLKKVLPFFVEMNPDALHTIEAPPTGNCSFEEAYSLTGNKMTLIGNIQYDDFRAFTPTQMKEAVTTILDECRGRRLILSPTAGPYEEFISEHMVENYLTFMRTAWEYPWR